VSNLRIATADDLHHAAEAIRNAPRVAVDTEFHAERRYWPRLYLVQVHVPGEGTWLIDPTREEGLDPVVEPLRTTPWLVHAGRQDIRILNRLLGGVPESILDTQLADGLLHPHYPAAFAHLVDRWLDQSIDKAATLSDWSRRPLSPDQLRYAAADVELLPDLWARLEAGLEAAGRLEVAKQVFEQARAEAISPEDPNQSWCHLHAAGLLDEPGRRVAQALASWREAIAQTRDQPTRSVLSDGVLLELARRRPDTVESLRSNRRFPKGVAKRYGTTIVNLVNTSSRETDTTAPQLITPRSPQSLRFEFLRAFSGVLAMNARFGRDLVLPTSTLRTLILTQHASRQDVARTLGSWRDTLVGDDMWNALHGGLALFLRDDATEICDFAPGREN